MEHNLINVVVLWLSEENVQDIPTIKSLSMKKLLALERHDFVSLENVTFTSPIPLMI